MKPRSSWTTKVGEVPSPLAELAALNPPIVVTEDMRKKAALELAEKVKPYRTKRKA